METIDSYLEALASADPTPGGGSAATIVAAAGAALVAMVARITLANAKLSGMHHLAQTFRDRADILRAQLLAARQVDELAYGEVVGAMALPRTTPAEKAARTDLLQAALSRAAAAPLHVASLSLQVIELAEHTLGLDNANLVSDVGCAAEFGLAALAASAFNVRINHKFLKDEELVAHQRAELHAIEETAAIAVGRIRGETDRQLA